MKKLGLWILSVIVIFLHISTALGQKTSGTIGVPNDTLSIAQLLIKLEQTDSDTSKVNLLNRIGAIYWYEGAPTGLDSCIFYARQAEKISNELNYIPGSNQAIFLICKAYVQQGDIKSASAQVNKVYGEERIRLLLTISEFYVFGDNAYLHKAYPIINYAKKLSDSINSTPWRYESLLLLGKYFFNASNFERGKVSFLQVINDCHRLKKTMAEAHYWSELGLYLPETDTTYLEKIRYHKMAYKLFMEVNAREDAAYSLRDAAQLNLDHNQPDTALRQMLFVIRILKEAQVKITSVTYMTLSDIYSYKGDYKSALTSVYNALSVLRPKDERKRAFVYQIIGQIYFRLTLFNKALPYSKLAIKYFIARNMGHKYLNSYEIVKELISLGQAKEALKFLLDFSKRNPTNQPFYKVIVAASFGNIYNALKQYNNAEKYYLEMVKQNNEALVDINVESQLYSLLESSDVYFIIGQFYVQRNKFAKARVFLLKSLYTPSNSAQVQVGTTEYLLFKADSALGALSSAIKHYIRHDEIKDSLFNIQKSNEISRLQIEFETTQNEQAIKLLQSQSKNQRADLEKISLQRNLTIGGTVVSLFIAGLIFNFYRQKRKSNLQLQHKQVEINDAYHKLEKLFEDKDKLLQDKEFLLREIHHRVKNNLQIIMSLLNSQSRYLDNDAAINAIKDSQHRLKSISLVHQKLYKSDNVSHIQIKSYVNEIISYLKESFDDGNHIQFEVTVDDIDFKVEKAISLGLFLNEAITNIFKYAFPSQQPGIVKIVLKEENEGKYFLSIMDNGVGLPPGLDIASGDSLGMVLMKGLSDQLEATLEFIETNGVHIRLDFFIDRQLYD